MYLYIQPCLCNNNEEDDDDDDNDGIFWHFPTLMAEPAGKAWTQKALPANFPGWFAPQLTGSVEASLRPMFWSKPCSWSAKIRSKKAFGCGMPLSTLQD